MQPDPHLKFITIDLWTDASLMQGLNFDLTNPNNANEKASGNSGALCV